MSAMVPTRPLSATTTPSRCLLGVVPCFDGASDLFFLLFNKELLHRVLLIMVAHQFLQFFLFLQHGPFLLYCWPPAVSIFFLVFCRGDRISHQLCNIIFLFLVVLPLVPCVVNSKHATQNSCTTKIINSKICAALILVFQKGKSFALAGFLVADQIDMHWLPIL